MLNKIRNFIETHNMFEPGDQVVIGLSGGADSICLLEVLWRLQKELSIRLAAVHVHHGLRGAEADRDAAFAKKRCEERSIPFRMACYDVNAYAAEKGLSTEEAGRTLRYQAFSEEAGKEENSKIAVAHHQDDNVETILLNLFRGTGLKGLGGIQPVRDRIVRPLLCVERSEIRNWLEEKGLSFCEDSTNKENDYTRNKLRNQVIPLIVSGINEKAVQNILRAGMLSRQADAYIEKRAEEILSEHVLYQGSSVGIGKPVLNSEDPMLGAYVVHRMLELAGGQKKDISSCHVDSVLGLFTKPVGRSVSLPFGLKAVCGYREVWITCASGEENVHNSSPEMQIPMEMTTFPYEKGKEIPKNLYTKWFDYGKIKGTLSVRTRETGDFITISGGGRKTVKSYMIDEKIPAKERTQIPLLAEGDHILWITGYRISEYYKVTDSTQTILQVIFDGGKDDGR